MRRFLQILCLATAMMAGTISAFAQSKHTVRGVVTDADGLPLMGAGVIITGTSTGVVTDMDGNFSIQVADNQSLEFSFLGYETVVEKVGQRAIINVMMEPNNVLEDAVVVGYGTQSRKTLTSAIAHVDGDKLADAPVSTVGDALKGKVTGLHIISNNNLPGEAPSFLIRGGSSINMSNAPLCLVDGVERSFEDLNPNDIESIEVLKDAASTSIYGSRASNGVILVTTRTGNQYKGPQIEFNAEVGFTSPSRRWALANSTQYLNIVRPAAAQGPNPSLVLDGKNGAGIGNTDATATYSTRYLAEGEAVPAGQLWMYDPVDPSKVITYTNRDWQSEWYKPALYHKEYIGINGGNQNIKYAASIGYLQDLGMVAMSAYQNFTMHGSTKFKITKNLEATTTFDFTRNLKNPMTSDYFAALGRGIMMSPTHIGKYPDGSFATGGTNKNQQTAEFYETFYDRENSRQKFMGSLALKWNITDWFTANAQYAYYDNSYRGSYYAYGQVISPEGGITNNFITGTRPTSESRTQTTQHNVQAYLAAKKDIKKHKIDATLGLDFSFSAYNKLEASSSGAENDKLPFIQSGSKGDVTTGVVSTFDASNTEYNTNRMSYFLRAGYNYADRYIVYGTFRADGSSLFAKGNRWGFFPSGSAAWVISEEPFFSDVKAKMNTLKLRVSYGVTGNDNISRTAPLGSYSLSDYAGSATLLPSVMQNSGLKWENTSQLDIGIDMGFVHDRVRLVLDYYNKRTDNMIFSITLPDTGQFSSVQANVGSARFYGFEVELHTVNIERKNFSWETDLTYSFNRNVVLSLPEEYAYDIKDMDGNPTGEKGYRIGGYTTANGYRFGGTAVGEPLGRIWGYKVAGILQNDEEAAAAYYDTQSHGYRRSDGLSITGRKDAGDFEWVNRYGTAKTADGAEQIDAQDMFCLGNVTPHSMGGFNNTIRWNRLTFKIYFDYAIGHSIYNYMKTRMVQNTLGYSNSNVDVNLFNQTWRKPGDGSQVARFFPNDADYGNRNYSRASDFNVENASYLCLRDASIYYDLPEKWVSKMHMKKFTIGVTGNTLCYFTKLSGAISPETGIAADAGGADLYSSVQMGSSNSNIMPSARKVMFNIKITF
ncbi:MAG: SusC/RagA family TonB-linked outer membrane protein [Bacteroidales bacterium]|nr:SusC/RagA family TonB-linked outer membrane protein [Bacteroidales bacterium]